MMCAAAAVVALAGVVRWMDLHRADGEVLENRNVRVVFVDSEADLDADRAADLLGLSQPRAGELDVASPDSAHAPSEVRAGELEVCVRFGGEPLSDAGVELLDITGALDVRARTDRDGLARLAARSGGWHTVRVEAADGTLAVREWEQGSARRMQFDFGGSSLAGQAFDCDGRPWAHAPLQVIQSAGDGAVRRELHADGDGRFQCAGLVAGSVTVAEALAQRGASEPRAATTVLGEGQGARLDLGFADALVAWRGLVRLRSARVLEEELELLAVESQRGWVEHVRSDEFGRIDARLRSGDWSVQVLAIDGVVEVLALELRSEDVERDVDLPGTCLRATLNLPSIALAEPEARGVLSIERGEGAQWVQVTPRDGRALVCGLAAGSWRFAAHRSGLEPEGASEWVVEGWEDVLDVTLEVLWGVPEDS